MGLLHIVVFSLYIVLYSFHFHDGVLLLERQSLCSKTPVIGEFQKSIQIISFKIQNFFSSIFMFCFAKTSSDLFLTYAFEYDYC